MIRRPLYIAGAVRDEPRRQAVLMIVPRPRRLRAAAATLIFGDHQVSFPDVVRHHSTRHLLHPMPSSIVDVAFTATRRVHSHDPALSVVRVCPSSVPGHVAARIIAESYAIHTLNAVRIHARILLNHRVLQWVAATHRVPHRRPIPVPVVIKPSRPRPPARRCHEPPDIVIGERLISVLSVYRP